jgi:hypothetical protein
MAKEMPLIRRVKECHKDLPTPEGFSVIKFEVETDSGPQTLRFTSNAAHDLKDLLRDLPRSAARRN